MSGDPVASTHGPMGIGRTLTGMRAFFAIWGGQLVSMVGTGLTAFALGVWVMDETGSPTRFTFIFVCTSLPGLLIAPVAGVFVDRWDRRWTMVLTDTGAAAITLAFAGLLSAGRLELWHLYVGMTLSSALGMFQWLSYSASVTLIVPKRHFGRVNGMRQFGGAAARVLAPLLAGSLLAVIGYAGVILMDVASFLAAGAVLLLVHVPRPEPVEGGDGPSIWGRAATGWLYIRERAALKGLLVLFAALNLVVGIAFVLITPLVLSFGTPEVLGRVMATAAGGMVAGSVLMSAWGGPPRRVLAILGALPVLGLGLLMAGARPSAPVVAAGLFLLMFTVPVVNTAIQSIWQAKVEPALQGRVFAVRRLLGQVSAPVAYAVAGPLAESVFEPAMAEGGALSPVLAPWLGSGAGRGIGLLYCVLAAAVLAIFVGSALSPRILNVDVDLPDAVPGDSTAQEEP